MRRDRSKEHFERWGKEIDFPLVNDFGYNDWHEASSLGWHSHEGLELLLVQRGGSMYEFEDGLTTLTGGQFFFTARGRRHRGVGDVNSPSQMFWIVFNPSCPDASRNSIFGRDDLLELENVCNAVHRRVYNISPTLNGVLTTFRDEIVAKRFGLKSVTAGMKLRALICQILVESLEDVERGRNPGIRSYVLEAKDRLETGFCQPIDMIALANEIGISRSYLCSIFKTETGQTLHDYLTRVRIAHAQRKLRDHSLSVTEVAIESGFNSSQDFSKVFRKYIGMTPTEYRTGQEKVSWDTVRQSKVIAATESNAFTDLSE